MRAITLTETGGAQASLTGMVELLGAELEHTAAANCQVQLTNASGQVISRLRTSAAGTDRVWWGADQAFDLKADLYYTLSAGTLTLWIK